LLTFIISLFQDGDDDSLPVPAGAVN